LKWVLQLYFFKLQNLVGHLKSIWVDRFAHMGVMTMSDMITGIQQTLNDIDRQALEGDWHLKFEVMTLLIASIETIMNELRNETKPKQKTIKKTNYIPKYKNVKRYVWAQEEPKNMGAWSYISPRLNEAGRGNVRYAGRERSASPATGSKAIHSAEQERLVRQAFSV